MKTRRKIEKSIRPGQILDAAEACFGTGEYAVAIIKAHAACELAIRERLEAKYGVRPVAVETLATDFAAQRPNSLKRLEAATGLHIEAETFWKPYWKSAAKRNSIVHRDDSATEAEARRAIKAAKAFMAFFEPAAKETEVIPGNHDVTDEFANLLRSLLASRGLTQKELAKRAKVSEQAISQLLCGKHSPTLRTIGRIAKVLGCKADIRMIDESP